MVEDNKLTMAKTVWEITGTHRDVDGYKHSKK